MISFPPRSGRQAGFTLLELLVIIAILAIVAGALLVAYDDVDDTAAEGVSAMTLASLDQAVRSYTAVERVAPNRLDSLLSAAVPTGGAPVDNSDSKLLEILPPKIQAKTLAITGLAAWEFAALEAAGITELRYVDPLANDLTTPAHGDTVTLTIPDADGSSAVVGPLAEIDIPHRSFETPRPGGKNRGRGYSGLLGVGSPVVRWNGDRSDGGGWYDNIKLKAAPLDVLILLGLGNDATIVGATGGRLQLTSAPIFNKGQKGEYSCYILAYNVGSEANPLEKAKLQCVLNTHGDFVDEMISEFSGQKN